MLDTCTGKNLNLGCSQIQKTSHLVVIQRRPMKMFHHGVTILALVPFLNPA
jgi:hypothetical protein